MTTTILHLVLIALFVAPFALITFAVRSAAIRSAEAAEQTRDRLRPIVRRWWLYALSRFARPLRWLRRHAQQIAELIYLLIP